MQLLGPYRTNLTLFHYEQLLDLLRTQVKSGDYAGSLALDEAAVQRLVDQSKDFESLPQPSAGQRLVEDSLNTPLDLLRARFAALVSESAEFKATVEKLLRVLEKDTSLLDRELAAADLERWASYIRHLENSTPYLWDFGMGYGSVSLVPTPTDPKTGATYTSRPPVRSYFDTQAGIFTAGLCPSGTERQFNVKEITWASDASGSKDILDGDDWSELTVLQTMPEVTFADHPAVNVLLPPNGEITGVYDVTGAVPGGSVPIFVRTAFLSRRNSIQLTVANALGDGTFESGSAGWTLGAHWSVDATPADAHTGNACLKRVASGTDTTSHDSFPTVAGANLYVDAWIRRTADANGLFTFILSYIDSDGNELSRTTSPAIPGTADYERFSHSFQVPLLEGISAAVLILSVTGHTTGTWYLDDIRAHVPMTLSAYGVDQDNVIAYVAKTGTDVPDIVYFQNTDYIVDENSSITFLNIPDATPLWVRFSELYPSYQCSVNEKDWSQPLMLDPLRPYPDDATELQPLVLGVNASGQRTLFPLTDETGTPLGLYVEKIGTPRQEYTFRVTTLRIGEPGIVATVRIQLERPAYINGLRIAPFTTYPALITSIDSEDFTQASRQPIFTGRVRFDRPMELSFPKHLVRSIYITLRQDNYTLKEFEVDTTDSLRREVLSSLQPVLPFSARRIMQATPVKNRGAQYEFGLQDIVGVDFTADRASLLVTGPYEFLGCPDIVRFDADYLGNADFYIAYQLYDSAGNLLGADLTGGLLAAQTAQMMNYGAVDRSTVARANLYLKIVNREIGSVVRRFQLQAVRR